MALSLLGHAAAFTALTQVQFTPASRRPIFDQFVRSQDHKIIYYRPPKVRADSAPEPQQPGPKTEARAWKISPRTTIATAPKPRSQQQMLLQNLAIQELPMDVPVPSIVAQAQTTSLPPKPKTQAKQFRPPPPSKQEPKLVTRTLVSDDPVPAIEAGGNPLTTVPSASMGTLPSKPSENLPVAPAPTQGNAKADVAIASINPSPAVEIPLANRPGAFARAPNPGDTAPGNNPGALTTSNLTVREPATKPASPAKAVIYAEKVRIGVASALSAPLRPSGRSVPRSLEARFAGRSVYTTVIPIENMPAYDGDWVLWFAEITPAPNQTPLVRAPAPNRKMEADVSRSSAVLRLQVAAVIGKDGKLRGASILPNTTASAPTISTAMQASALDDIQSWEFTPAMRNGTAIDVDAVFDIPFHLPQ